jgi:hypothetical protein
MSAEQRRPAAALHGSPAREPRGLLPAWPAVVAVVAGCTLARSLPGLA